MIDYIPPDIPPAIVKFADEHYKNQSCDVTGRSFKYLTIWKGNLEIYMMNWKYKPLETDPKTEQPIVRYIGLPNIVLYDCHDVRKPKLEEIWDINFFMPVYIYQNLKSEHLCHRDLEAFNQHKTPNPYKQKPKYITPRYIPKPVVKYIDAKYPVSWYPDTYIRYIKYLTTFEDKYEVYFVYWNNPKTNKRSKGKYVLYDCENVREHQNIREYFTIVSLRASDNNYSSNEKPLYCKSK